MKLLIVVTHDDRTTPALDMLGREVGFRIESAAAGTLLVTTAVCPEEYTAKPDTISEIWSKAKAWIQLISGSLAVLGHGRLEFKNLMRECESGHREWLPIIGSINEVASVAFATSGSPKLGAAPWLDIATSDAAVRRVLKEWAGKTTWVSLYRILEVIKDDLGELRALGSVSKSDLERVKKSANHPDISGESGRHAVSKSGPPKDSVTLEGAARTMREWSKAWLQSKASGASAERTG